jgi:hypothetical protein
MIFDILEEQLCIEFVGKVTKKDLSELLRDCRQVRMGRKGVMVVSDNEYYNEFGQVLNSVGGGVAYTTNVDGMFYTNLATDLCNQVKAGGYLSPESFTSNDAHVKDLRTLRDLALRAELEVAKILGISK